jgi:CheY-like chemotaxis protein
MPPHPSDVLWTENDIWCVLARTGNRLEVLVQRSDDPPFIRKIAQSTGDARNEGEYLRVLLDRRRAPAAAETPREPPLVLIVEDDPDNLLAYEEILKLDGFAVASAATVLEANRIVRSVTPAAVLLDHMLPDGSGSSLCVTLRRTAGHALPIVMVTGLNPRDITMGGDEGPDAVMSKPCRPDLLTALLKLLILRERASASPRSEPSAEPEAPAADTPPDEFPDAT